jgi:hypothetical protein
MTKITELKDDGEIEDVASYTLSPKKALIAFVMREIFKNGNTWEYPEELEGITERRPGHFWFRNYRAKTI